jgi:hypothetical protein
LLPDGLKAHRLFAVQTEPKTEDRPLFLVEIVEQSHQLCPLTEERADRSGRGRRVGVHPIAQHPPVLPAGRRVEPERSIIFDLLQLGQPLDGDVCRIGDLLKRRRSAERLNEPILLLAIPAKEDFDMHRQSKQARLVGERPDDGLADPPRRVGAEFRAAVRTKCSHRPQEAEVSLLDQIHERQPSVRVSLRDLHDEPEVGLDKPMLRLWIPGGDLQCQRLLFIRGHQGDPRDFQKVQGQECLFPFTSTLIALL